MKPCWHFNEHRPRDTTHDSANDAFFTADKLANLSEALVREGIQNSLDAAARDTAGVREVHIRINLVHDPAPPAQVWLKSAFDSSREHFAKGVHGNDVIAVGPSGYLSFEDFGTTGLTGNVKAHRLSESANNAFWAFFRAIGISAKGEDKLGRWGIGKQVFPTSSRVRAMFGITNRADTPSRVLMGAAVLRSRTIGESDFDAHARYGLHLDDQHPILPVQDAKELDEFIFAFGLQRGNKPGLSIVVPWIDARITAEDLRRGVVRNFFWPLLRGELTVEIQAEGNIWQLDAETATKQLDLLEPAEAEAVRLAEWAAFAKGVEIVKLPVAAATKPVWTSTGDGLFPPDIIATIRTRLETTGKTGIEIPVRVRPKGGQETQGKFLIFYAPCKEAGHPTIFLRDGIVITDVARAPSGASYSLVVVENGPLARLLGDSEGVNHTQWQRNSDKFNDRYVWGPETINFVSRAVGEFLRRLHPGGAQKAPELLLDLFFVKSEDASTERKAKPSPEKGGETSAKGGGAEAKPRRYELQRVQNGFVLVPGKTPPTAYPVTIRIEAGYAVRRGDGIDKWGADDFRFVIAPLHYEPKTKGATVLSESGNQLTVELRQPDFIVGVSGFDRRRDLELRVEEMKNEADI